MTTQACWGTPALVINLGVYKTQILISYQLMNAVLFLSEREKTEGAHPKET